MPSRICQHTSGSPVAELVTSHQMTRKDIERTGVLICCEDSEVSDSGKVACIKFGSSF